MIVEEKKFNKTLDPIGSEDNLTTGNCRNCTHLFVIFKVLFLSLEIQFTNIFLA